MSEIVNLRRVRKAKERAGAAAKADANRAKHGAPKPERDLARARAERAAQIVDMHKLDDKR